MSDQQQGATAPGAPAPTAPAAPAAPSEPFAVFPDAESFQKRIEREARKRLKDLGIDDPEQAKVRLDAAAALEKQAEEARRAQMSEVERLRTDLAEKERAATGAMSRAEEAEMKAHLYRVFAEKGIRNFDYGFFAITNKLASMPDEETLDERAFLDELAKDPSQAVALGIAAPAPAAPPTRPAPVTSTPSGGFPPTAPQPGAPAPAKTAFDMTPAEWTAFKSRNGIA